MSVYSYRVQSQLCCFACQESSHSSQQLTWPVKLHLKRHQCEMKPCQISTQQKLPGLQACSSMFSTFSCRTKATLLSCCTGDNHKGRSKPGKCQGESFAQARETICKTQFKLTGPESYKTLGVEDTTGYSNIPPNAAIICDLFLSMPQLQNQFP